MDDSRQMKLVASQKMIIEDSTGNYVISIDVFKVAMEILESEKAVGKINYEKISEKLTKLFVEAYPGCEFEFTHSSAFQFREGVIQLYNKTMIDLRKNLEGIVS